MGLNSMALVSGDKRRLVSVVAMLRLIDVNKAHDFTPQCAFLCRPGLCDASVSRVPDVVLGLRASRLDVACEYVARSM